MPKWLRSMIVGQKRRYPPKMTHDHGSPGWEARRPTGRRHGPFGMIRIVLVGERGAMCGRFSGMSGHTLLAGKAGLGRDRLMSDSWAGTVPDVDEARGRAVARKP